jgi:hypothetical protein
MIHLDMAMVMSIVGDGSLRYTLTHMFIRVELYFFDFVH